MGLLGAAAGCLALALPGGAYAAFPGANGRIAYTVQQWRLPQDPGAREDELVSSRIETVQPNGRRRRVLLACAAVSGCSYGEYTDNLAWSPDGRRLAFGGRQLTIVRHDGTDLRQLPELTVGAEAPDWSPEGRRLVFQASAPGDYPSLYAVRSDGTGLRRVTDEWASSPAWSSTGRIAFVNDDEPHSWRYDGIYTVRPDGSRLRRVFGRLWGTGAQPDWSPNGRRLAFSARRHIFTIGARGRQLRRLTKDSDPPEYAQASHPAWSPDGRYIAFLRSQAEPVGDGGLRRTTAIYVMRSNGRGLRRVVAANSLVSSDGRLQEYEVVGLPAWQPLRRRGRAIPRTP